MRLLRFARTVFSKFSAPGAFTRVLARSLPVTLLTAYCSLEATYKTYDNHSSPDDRFAQNFSSTKKQLYKEYSFQRYKEALQNGLDVVILIDNDYTPSFSSQLESLVRTLPKDKVVALRATPQQVQEIKSHFKLELHPETIFLMKNKFSDSLEPFLFEEVMQHPKTMRVFFSPLPVLTAQQVSRLEENLKLMSLDHNLLVYFSDKEQPDYSQYQKMFKSMQLAIAQSRQAPQTLIMLVNQREYLSSIGLEGVNNNSLHLIKRHSESLNTADPNLQLYGRKYHHISNIKLFGVESDELLIPAYLSQIETFTKDIYAPYNIKVIVDKNLISKTELQQLLSYFKDIKKNNRFKNTNYSIKFAEVAKKKNQENRGWEVKVHDNQNQQKQLQILDGSSSQSLQTKLEIGKHTYEYLYQGKDIEGLTQFIEGVTVSHTIPEHFRSEQVEAYEDLHKLTASTFGQKVLKNELNHLVLQYSDGCSGCKQISPFIKKFNDTNTSRYINKILLKLFLEKIEVHRINSIKNIVEQQIEFPYTPVLLFYKNEWKPRAVQLESHSLLRNQNIIKYFCQIMTEVNSIDAGLLEKVYEQRAKRRIDWQKLKEN